MQEHSFSGRGEGLLMEVKTVYKPLKVKQFYFDIILLVYIFSTEQYTFSRCNVEHNGWF